MIKNDGFYVNESGEVIREVNHDESVLDKTAERTEYSQLEYEIFSHPDRFSQEDLQAKKKRFEELKQILEIDDEALTLKMAQRKLELKAKSADNSLLKNAMLNLKKNKEAGQFNAGADKLKEKIHQQDMEKMLVAQGQGRD